MTQKNNGPGVREPFLDGKKGRFNITKEQLSDMFHPDNVKSISNEGLTISIFAYWKTYGGAEGLCKALGSDVKNGIEGDQKDIAERQEIFGLNSKRPPKIKTLMSLILENFEDRILQVLLLAALVSLIIGIWENGWSMGWIDGLSIFVAVFIIVTVSSANNYAKEKQFQKLVAKSKEDVVPVFRGREGATQTINTDDLVVGDIIKLESGARIPADCIALEATDMAADESAMTGEPEQVEKSSVNQSNVHHHPNPFLLANTLILQGSGIGLVCAVGTATRSGMAEEKLSIEEEETPLQVKLETIANEIGKLGVYVAVTTFVVMSIKLIIVTALSDEGFGIEILSDIVDYVIISITIIVVAVPEGLPLAVTIALAFSVAKMKIENNLVRKLHASETMGGADQICTDKTGTLTQNKMTVQEIYTQRKVYKGKIHDYKQLPVAEILKESILFNCSARIEKNDKGELETKGNVTEQGIIKYLLLQDVDCYNDIRKKEDNILALIPFNSKRKKATTVIRHPSDQSKVRIFSKGAPEYVIDSCKFILNEQGKPSALSPGQKDEILKDIVTEQFAKKAYRTILTAYHDMTFKEFEDMKKANNGFAKEGDREALEQNMTAVCIFALMDPLRPEVVDSVIRCHKSGVNVRMCTGDNLDTAIAISIQAGIVRKEDINDKYVCMEGKEFREALGKLQSHEEDGRLKESLSNVALFRQIASKLQVLARSTPEDKYILVTGLKEIGHVVAVTGDGTNDAPALKKADVGFAMGITGTEVAKEASDIVLLDDNFSSIITAIKWGRNIFTNVRKFLQFQLTVNIVAMFIVFIGGVAISDSPLTSVQMLWVNLIMDTFAALALATEPPSDDLLDEKPYTRDTQIVNTVMWRNILGQAVYQIIVLLVILFAPSVFGFTYDTSLTGDCSFYLCDYTVTENTATNETTGLEYTYNTTSSDGYHDPMTALEKTTHYTLLFNTFVFMQVFNQINSRKLGERDFNVFKGFFNNWLFLTITIVTIVVQSILVEIGGSAMRCTPLSWNYFFVCLGIGFGSLINGVIIKFIPARWFERLNFKEEKMSDEEEAEAFTSKFRKSYRQSKVSDRRQSGNQGKVTAIN